MLRSIFTEFRSLFCAYAVLHQNSSDTVLNKHESKLIQHIAKLLIQAKILHTEFSFDVLWIIIFFENKWNFDIPINLSSNWLNKYWIKSRILQKHWVNLDLCIYLRVHTFCFDCIAQYPNINTSRQPIYSICSDVFFVLQYFCVERFSQYRAVILAIWVRHNKQKFIQWIQCYSNMWSVWC